MSQLGYWEPKTSNIDWCEDNYYISYYIAEWYNSLSNLIPIFYSIYILYNLKFTYNNINYYHISYILLIFVFIGSFCFHATLTNVGQMLDEIPMLITNVYMIYLLDNYNIKKLIYNIILKIIFILWMYYYPNSPLPFQLSFIVFNLILFSKVFNIIIKYPVLKRKTNLNKSIFYYIIAIICWLLDLFFCSYLKYFYLHSFWHIYSYIGCLYLLNFIFIYLSFINSKILPKYFQDLNY
jgi:dihydroceramidase